MNLTKKIEYVSTHNMTIFFFQLQELWIVRQKIIAEIKGRVLFILYVLSLPSVNAGLDTCLTTSNYVSVSHHVGL